MKARKRGTNEPFEDVSSVLFYSGGYILIKDVEFEQEPNTIDHWQELRERAAIAAMHALLAQSGDAYTELVIAREAVIYADALVEKLKGE